MIEHLEWIERLAVRIRDGYQRFRYSVALSLALKFTDSAGFWKERTLGRYDGPFHRKRGYKWDY